MLLLFFCRGSALYALGYRRNAHILCHRLPTQDVVSWRFFSFYFDETFKTRKGACNADTALMFFFSPSVESILISAGIKVASETSFEQAKFHGTFAKAGKNGERTAWTPPVPQRFSTLGAHFYNLEPNVGSVPRRHTETQGRSRTPGVGQVACSAWGR